MNAWIVTISPRPNNFPPNCVNQTCRGVVKTIKTANHEEEETARYAPRFKLAAEQTASALFKREWGDGFGRGNPTGRHRSSLHCYSEPFALR